MMQYMGFDIIVSPHLPPIVTFDWSACRSPSRAKRRHARGIKTRVVVKTEPNNSVYLIGRQAIMSPAALTALRLKMEKELPCIDSSPGFPSYLRTGSLSPLRSGIISNIGT